MRGELADVQAADLRFSTAEATAYLIGTMGRALSAQDVAMLEGRTEGGSRRCDRRQCRCAAARTPPPSSRTPPGDDWYVVDFLVEEVLARQPERSHFRPAQAPSSNSS